MGEEILSMKGVNKSFPGVQALKEVDFSCRQGEVHALVGHNGAGKSTLIKVLGGVYKADSGEIYLRGNRFKPDSPLDGTLAGISIIYQEFNLIPDLTVAKNMFLAREPRTKLGFLDQRSMIRKSRQLLERLSVENVTPVDFIRDLSVNQMQLVEIAKALSVKADIIVMDEPTAALPISDVQKLFDRIRKLKAEGVTIIYISHRMEDIFEVADRVTLMKDGRMIATLEVEELDHNTLIEKMTGRSITDFFPPRKPYKENNKTVFEVTGLKSMAMKAAVSFEIRENEIFGITGLEGCGSTELARALFGVDRIESGEVEFKEEGIKISTPREGLFQGFGYLTKDRRNEGLLLGASLRENIAIPSRVKKHRGFFLDLKKELAQVERIAGEMNIRAGNLNVESKDLSGGNQQKVIISKWLLTECKVLIVDEPTRGIDVDSKVEIYQLMRNLVESGVVVIVLSSDMEEILGLCDRILVLHRGEPKAVLNWEKATEHVILLAATGSKLDQDGEPTRKMNGRNGERI